MEKSLLDYEQKRFNNFTNSFEMDDETRKKCTKDVELVVLNESKIIE